MRCKAICVGTGRRCKKSCSTEFCNIHDESITCELCNNSIYFSEKQVLDCGHIFCKGCLGMNYYKNFSTEDTLQCPHCLENLNDTDWQKVSSHMVDTTLVYRRKFFKIYLCHEEYLKVSSVLNLGEIYEDNTNFRKIHSAYFTSNKQIFRYGMKCPLVNVKDEDVDIVYFEKWLPLFNQKATTYQFLIGDEKIKSLFEDLRKELVEYVFHPSRFDILNAEDL